MPEGWGYGGRRGTEVLVGANKRHCRSRSRDVRRRADQSRPAAREARNALTYHGDCHKRRRPSSPSHCSISDCSRSGATPSEEYSSSYSSSSSPAGKAVAGSKNAGAGKKEQKTKDEIMHFEWTEDMTLHERYRVKKLLGDGTFGRVLLAEDQKRNREVAIKVIRDVEKYTRNAQREAEILRDIKDADKKKAKGCVRMHDTFTHEGKHGRNFCMSFEVMGGSLYDLLKRNKFRGLWMQDIQSIAQQCLEALAFLHDDLNLTHTDLKLENILFQSSEPPVRAEFPRQQAWLESRKSQQGRTLPPYVRPVSTQIKLIDFGNATYELEHHSSIINTRQYRAPEVILSLGWNERSDLWSVGCILMELYTAELLFRTHDSLEHLCLMERAVQPFPMGMLGAAGEAKKEQYLTQDAETRHWRLSWPDRASSESSRRHVESQKHLAKLVLQQHRSLADCVASLLVLEPERRPGAATALMHPFFWQQFPD